ncbi:hypothetical protein M0R45_006524 [Rubus argutus]|uniref:Uncharacterized protein n=1 Tax=Rubus argutus TaxID=59490 RepID=A0AAW1YQU9_RUBAR
MKKKKEHGFRLMRKTWMLLFGRCNASTIMCLEISLVTFLLQDNYTSGLEALAQTFLKDHRYCGHTPQGITFVYTKFIFDSLLNCSISAYCGFSLIHYICHFDFSGSTMLGLPVPVSTCISILEWIISELDHQFLLDNAYYFEMKDAGFFDADWD